MTMATFVLIHGGGDAGWYWHLVERELRQRGHDTLSPDLPCDDDSAGLAEYAGRQDLIYHDVQPALAETARRYTRNQSDTPGQAPWPLQSWPPAPTRFVLCTEDRFFPAAFMRRVVAERLGIVPDAITAGHAVTLSRPKELASPLASYSPNAG
jgi:pimeloyl-ACP methyl ester carboxylesterase